MKRPSNTTTTISLFAIATVALFSAGCSHPGPGDEGKTIAHTPEQMRAAAAEQTAAIRNNTHIPTGARAGAVRGMEAQVEAARAMGRPRTGAH